MHMAMGETVTVNIFSLDQLYTLKSGADPGFDQGGPQIVTGLKLPFWGLNFVEFWCWGLIFGDQGGPGPPGPPLDLPLEIEDGVWQFFCEARSQNMPVNGGLLKSEALEIAKNKGYNEFSASNGWLEAFIARHQIKFSNLHGESAGVDPKLCDQWKENLPWLCEGYNLKDIYNCDETGIFFRSIPKKSFRKKGEVNNGTKAQTMKERFTVLMTYNAVGDKEKLWIIGKIGHPCSFPKKLPKSFNYGHNSKAWVTSEIFMEYLSCLNVIIDNFHHLLMKFHSYVRTHFCIPNDKN